MAWITGYPREKVEWYPTIDTKKVSSGGRDVYELREKCFWLHRKRSHSYKAV